MQIIELQTTGKPIKVYFKNGLFPEKCADPECNKTIYWGKTEAGKNMPVSKQKDGTYISHFADCKGSNQFRK